MGNPKWIIGVLFLFVVSTVLCSIVEGLGVGTGMEQLTFIINPMNMVLHPITYLGVFWEALWFRYSFFDGYPYNYFRYIIFLPISAGLVFTLVVSAITGVIGLVRR